MWCHNRPCLSRHRRQTEDVGLRRGGRCVRAPGVYSVHGLLSMVSDSKMTVSAQIHPHHPHHHHYPRHSSVLTRFVFIFPPFWFFSLPRAAVTAPCAALGPRSTLPAVQQCGWAGTLTSSPSPTLNASSLSPAMVRVHTPDLLTFWPFDFLTLWPQCLCVCGSAFLPACRGTLQLCCKHFNYKYNPKHCKKWQHLPQVNNSASWSRIFLLVQIFTQQ